MGSGRFAVGRQHSSRPMSDDTLEILGVGDRLREDIEEGPFDRFVIFTYGITTEYLDWFDPDDEVAICGPNETVEAVRETDTSPSIKEYNRKTHAKIYLLYNDSRVVAYLGSFNFTRNGLYGGVEWGARYEGDLTHSPAPKELISGEAPAELSSSPIIEQIATIVGASMTGNDTHAADSWVANTGLGEGVVHTLTSNTLQSALTDMLRDVEPPLELSYYTPFVTRVGISEFMSYLPETLDESDIEFKIYTKRLSRLEDDEQILSADEIAALDEQFGSFQLRVRAPGDQGNELADGREIRSGMAHLKAITLAEQTEPATRSIGTILTSANLSERAWSRESVGFEIGVALEGTRDSERLHRFFTKALPRAYINPSERDLETAGGTGTPQTHGTETWLDTRLRDRMTLSHNSVSITWNDSLPSIDSLSGTLRIRDTSTGERTRHDLEFTRTGDGFVASFPSVAGQPNRIIDFVRLAADTRHAPPELEYTAHDISKFRAEEGIEGADDPLPDEWQSYDEIIWNGTVSKPVTDASFGDVEEIQSVQLRATHDTPETYYAILEPDAQPHIDQLLHGIDTATESIDPIGELPRLRIETHPTVDPDPQDIVLYTERGKRVRPIGFTANSEDGALYYYLPRELAGETLTVEIEGLLSRYVQHGSAEIVVPALKSSSPVELERHFSTDPWRVVPGDVHPVLKQKRYPGNPFVSEAEPSPEDHISTETGVTVTPAEELVETVDEDRLAFWWRPSGVFRSGTSQSISKAIPKQEVRTRVSYRGIIRLNGNKGPVNIWLPGGEYVVKEQPFVDDIEVSLEGIPSGQRLDRIRSGTLLGWATIQRDTLMQPRASDVTECINARLYVDGEPVEHEIFAATSQGGTLLFPVLGEHIGTTQALTLRLWISGGPAKTTTYTEIASDIELSVTDSDDSLQITLGRQTKRVSDGSTNPTIDLKRFIEKLEVGEFESETKATRSNELFAVESYDPLCIQPNRMVLLYFTDK